MLPFEFDSAQLVPAESVFGFRMRVDTVGSGLMWFVTIAAIVTIVGNVLHVISRPSVHKHRLVAVTSLLPNAVVLLMYVQLHRSFPELMEQAPFVAELCYGFFSSYSLTRLTVARLCSMSYRPFSLFFLASVGIVGGAIAVRSLGLEIGLLSPYWTGEYLSVAMRILLWVGVAQYLHLIISVFRQMSHFLDIRIFKVKSFCT
jgi:hypothetical protein